MSTVFRIYIVLIFIWITANGCFRRWSMSEKQIHEHYRNKPVKPSFFTIRNDSVKLYCATTGSDTLPPLLMIHGAPGAWYSGLGILDDPQLQKKYHIIAVDRPGYGKSRFKGKKRALTSIQMQASVIYHALQLNKSHKKGVVYGTSYGAPIAAMLDVMHPEEFYHLVMIGPAIDPDHEKFWWFHRYVGGILVRLFLPHFINIATDEKFAHIKELKKLLPYWKMIDVPVTVIQGSEDSIVPLENFDFAKEQFKGKDAEFIMVKGAGHLVRRDRPEVIRNVLLKIAR